MENNIESDVNDEQNDDIEIDVVDDTPQDDQGRKPVKEAVVPADEEAEQYSDNVKKRLGALKHQFHDERRSRESAERERDEAVRVAQVAYQRTKQLEQQLTFGEASYAGEVQEKAVLSVASAKEKYRKAFDAGDPDALAEAAEELATASQASANAKQWQAQAKKKAEDALQTEKTVVESPQSRQSNDPAPAKPDQQALDWASDNKDWFGTDPTMTSLAYGVHERLVKAGVSPVEDAEEYYSSIDAEMRKRYPEYAWQGDSPAQKQEPAKKPKPAVASVNRVPSGNKAKITLTKSQVAMAERLNLTLEQYARELVKLERGA